MRTAKSCALSRSDERAASFRGRTLLSQRHIFFSKRARNFGLARLAVIALFERARPTRASFFFTGIYAPSSYQIAWQARKLHRIALVKPPFPPQSDDRRTQDHPPPLGPNLFAVNCTLLAIFLYSGFSNLVAQKADGLPRSVPSPRIYALSHIPKGIKSYTY